MRIGAILFRRVLGSLAIVLLAAGWAAGSAWAASDTPLRMGLPLRCDPGTSCWIVNYVDHDPGPGVRDYACGHATYNEPSTNAHSGTDFAIRDGRAMRAGVAVLAAADGTVTATRDGEADADIKADARPVSGGKDCGNGVVIDHGNDWTTQYCHLRKGSVAVQPRQRVRAGQSIGLVGLSGFTQFPHVHITVRHAGTVIDPFVGLSRAVACGVGDVPLWDTPVLARLPYQPTAIYNGGFAGEKPSPARARNGDYDVSSLDRRAAALVLWADLFNVMKDDRILFSIRGPDGGIIVEHADPVDKDQARRFVFAGRPLKGGEWPAGVYTGTVVVERPNRAGPPTPQPFVVRTTLR